MKYLGKPLKTFSHASVSLDGTNEYWLNIDTPCLALDMTVVKKTASTVKVNLWNYTRNKYLVWNKEITDATPNINLRGHILNLGDVLAVKADGVADVSLTFLPINVAETMIAAPLKTEVRTDYNDKMLFFHQFEAGHTYSLEVETDDATADLPTSGALEVRTIAEGFSYSSGNFTGTIATIKSVLLQDGNFMIELKPSPTFAGLIVYGSGAAPARSDGYLRLEFTEDSRIRLKTWDS